jgi:dTDP-4-dehydrorhamnose reductase
MVRKNVLLLGASGMLGSTLLRYFASQEDIELFATARSLESVEILSDRLKSKILFNVDVENSDHLIKVFSKTQPDIVVNCVGIVKQLTQSNDPLTAIPINSLLPHRLAHLAAISQARLIHFSTDCVFSGAIGNYSESDLPDAFDLYGQSKLIGEVSYPNAVTLRTSLIGHELSGNRSLVNWFLSQTGSVKGFRRAIFSGLPTIEIARVIHKFVLPSPELHGLYHLSVDPISKFDLLSLVAKVYSKDIDIIPDDSLIVDRSLDSSRFRAATGFSPKPWPELIQAMHDFG